MTEQGGFLEPRRSNPIGLGFVIALHGAALAALILAPPELVPIKIFKPLKIKFIEDNPPPPPLPPERRTKADPETMTVPKDRTVFVPTTGTIVDPPLDPPPLPPRDPPIEPSIQQPVLVEASPDPRFLSALQPPYPAALAREGIAGRVVVRVLIGVDGRVKAVEPVSATDPAFAAATAEQALKRWRFRPAMRDGVAVESWRTMAVRFEMKA